MSEQPKVKPALSRAEWEGVDVTDADGQDAWIEDDKLYFGLYPGYAKHGRLHALAALCLHEQEFGFTREDVQMVREAYITRRDPTSFQGTPVLDKDATERLHSIADRIEALLPPEEET